MKFGTLSDVVVKNALRFLIETTVFYNYLNSLTLFNITASLTDFEILLALLDPYAGG